MLMEGTAALFRAGTEIKCRLEIDSYFVDEVQYE